MYSFSLGGKICTVGSRFVFCSAGAVARAAHHAGNVSHGFGFSSNMCVKKHNSENNILIFKCMYMAAGHMTEGCVSFSLIREGGWH